MNVAVIGSVSSSVAALDALIRAGVHVTGVLGVDEAAGRRICDYRALRPVAAAAGVPFHGFVKVEEPGVERFLRAHAPDLLWVIGLSQLVPARLIEIARHGGVGFHPTMLPSGRGRAPVAWTILRGEPAAVSLFYITDEPDAGDIIVQRPVAVRPDDYAEDLIARTNDVLTAVILEAGPAIIGGTLPRTPQDHTRATYYEKRTAADGRIDWCKPTDDTYRLIRAAGRPYHGAFTYAGSRRIIVWRAAPCAAPDTYVASRAAPGSVLRVDGDRGALVQTADGALWLTDVQAAADADAARRGSASTMGVDVSPASIASCGAPPGRPAVRRPVSLEGLRVGVRLGSEPQRS